MGESCCIYGWEQPTKGFSSPGKPTNPPAPGEAQWWAVGLSCWVLNLGPIWDERQSWTGYGEVENTACSLNGG